MGAADVALAVELADAWAVELPDEWGGGLSSVFTSGGDLSSVFTLGGSLSVPRGPGSSNTDLSMGGSPTGGPGL